jgi:hypothetical protein
MGKRVKSTIFILILCISLLLTVVACGGDKTPSSLEGKYVISAMTYGEEDFLQFMQNLAKEMGEEINLEEFMHLEFLADGSVTFGEDGEEETGTFTFDGKTVVIAMGEETMTGTVDGNSIVVVEEDNGQTTTMTFTKK